MRAKNRGKKKNIFEAAESLQCAIGMPFCCLFVFCCWSNRYQKKKIVLDANLFLSLCACMCLCVERGVRATRCIAGRSSPCQTTSTLRREAFTDSPSQVRQLPTRHHRWLKTMHHRCPRRTPSPPEAHAARSGRRLPREGVVCFCCCCCCCYCCRRTLVGVLNKLALPCRPAPTAGNRTSAGTQRHASALAGTPPSSLHRNKDSWQCKTEKKVCFKASVSCAYVVVISREGRAKPQQSEMVSAPA